MTVTPDAGQVAGTNQHYDLDPDVFGLFLHPLRKYSCGLYESPNDTLAVAQRRKLRFVAGRLGITGGEQLLDVGCGWGPSCCSWPASTAAAPPESARRRASTTSSRAAPPSWASPAWLPPRSVISSWPTCRNGTSTR